jgi:hypothetical protein
MNRAEHWEQVYQTKGPDQVSWFQAEARLSRQMRPGGLVIIATFADDGPLRCSGLEVARYSPRDVHPGSASCSRRSNAESPHPRFLTEGLEPWVPAPLSAFTEEAPLRYRVEEGLCWGGTEGDPPLQRSRERGAAMLLAIDFSALRGKLCVTQGELHSRLVRPLRFGCGSNQPARFPTAPLQQERESP